MRRTLAVVALAVLAGCGNGVTIKEAKPTEPPQARPVTFYVEGKGTRSADLTIGIGSDTTQAADRRVPLGSDDAEGLTVDAFPGDFLYISAQRNSDNGGTITCRIEVDGIVIDEGSSVGAYTIASCKARMP